MNEFNTKDFQFTIPDSWKEVTIGQYMALMAPDAPQTSAYIITTLTGKPESYFKGKRSPIDLNALVLKSLGFLLQPPTPDEVLPKTLVIDGKKVKLPDDLGAEADLGQFWDVDLVIRSRNKDNLSVDPLSMADLMLTVFLWPMLKDEPYKDRYEAAELWPVLSQLPCIDGLAISGFFLRNILSPAPTGKVSVTQHQPTRPRKWRQRLHQAWQRLTNTLPANG